MGASADAESSMVDCNPVARWITLSVVDFQLVSAEVMFVASKFFEGDAMELHCR